MGNPLTSADFRRLLDMRLKEVADNDFMELESGIIEKLYRVLPSDSAYEEFMEVGAIADIPAFNGKLETLGMSPGFLRKIEPKEFGAMTITERKFFDDEKYGVTKSIVRKQMESAMRVRDKYAVRPIANAFSGAFDFMQSEEGVALCSDSHSTRSGTSTATGFDNAGTTALSKTAVAATRLLMRGFRNDISERITISDQLALIVPDSLADLAGEITGTPAGYDTAAMDKNMDYKRYDVIPLLRLDDYDANNWFMVDVRRMKEKLLWIDRIKPQTMNTVDFDSLAYKQAIYFRFANGPIDWRFIYGHQVS